VQVLETVAACKAALRPLQRQGQTIGFVPTMGALHAGHVSLVDLSREHCSQTVVSIFVNPTQFGPNEDFSKYPRTLADDLAKLEAAGCDFAFVPAVAALYHPNEDLAIHLPALSQHWEGAMRPGHFNGVALVVAKLLNIVRPDQAFFGQKDFQQTVVVRRLARDLFLDTAIVVGPTMREADGLAMSSRNRYLDADQRALAPRIYKTLKAVKAKAAAGMPTQPLCQWAATELTHDGAFVLDYFDIVDSDSLEHIPTLQPSQKPVAIVTARLGTTRLLDNLPLFA
jgi:pantoate--beta-alanine ligase